MNAPDFICDLSGSGDDFPHYWEHTVGSDHATLAFALCRSLLRRAGKPRPDVLKADRLGQLNPE